MKKYGKLIVLTIVSIVLIGSYYIQSTKAMRTVPNLQLQVISGAQEELEKLSIQGVYEEDHLYKELILSKEGTTFVHTNSLIEELFGTYKSPELSDYQAQYSSFMRSKSQQPLNYAEDATRILYVDWVQEDRASELVYEVDVLTKETKERTAFTVQSAIGDQFKWATVYNMYVQDQFLHVLAEANEQYGNTVLYTYTIDLDQQMITHETVLGKWPHTTALSIYNRYFNIENERYIMYAWSERYTDDGEIKEDVPLNVSVYDMQIGSVEQLVLPFEELHRFHQIILSDESAYIVLEDAEQATLYRYDFEQKAWDAPQTLTYPAMPGQETYTSFHLIADKLYVAFRTQEWENYITVYDLQQGKELAVGQITLDEEKVFDFMVEHMTVQE